MFATRMQPGGCNPSNGRSGIQSHFFSSTTMIRWNIRADAKENESLSNVIYSPLISLWWPEGGALLAFLSRWWLGFFSDLMRFEATCPQLLLFPVLRVPAAWRAENWNQGLGTLDHLGRAGGPEGGTGRLTTGPGSPRSPRAPRIPGPPWSEQRKC